MKFSRSVSNKFCSLNVSVTDKSCSSVLCYVSLFLDGGRFYKNYSKILFSHGKGMVRCH